MGPRTLPRAGPWLLAAAMAGLPGAATANFGFAPSPDDTCLVALDPAGTHPSGEVPFYWARRDGIRSSEPSWRYVFRDSRFRAKYEEASRRRVDVTKPLGPAAEPKVIPPPNLRVVPEPCLKIWDRYWRYVTQTSPGADPAAAGDYAFDTAIVSKGVFSVENNGTGFYLSKQGLFITNYHVAKHLCKIPRESDLRAAIRCSSGYTLHAFPAWKDYVDGHDYVLMSRSRAPRDIVPLKLRADLPKVLERVFLAGFPERVYSGKEFDVFSAQVVYPVANSGKRFMGWDPLVFSTGRLSMVLDTAVFPGSSRHISLGTSSSYLPDAVRFSFELYEWDQDIMVSHSEVPSGPGSSGSPLLDKQGRVIGILHRSDMYYSTRLMVQTLNLCDATGAPERSALARELEAQGICRDLEKPAPLARAGSFDTRPRQP